jgi:hypothetical protein
VALRWLRRTNSSSDRTICGYVVRRDVSISVRALTHPFLTSVWKGLVSSLTPVSGKRVEEVADSDTSGWSQAAENTPTIPADLRIERYEPKTIGTCISSLCKGTCSRCSRNLPSSGRKRCALTAKDVAQDLAVINHIEAPILWFNSPVAERAVGMTMWVEAFMPPSAWSSSVPASALGAWALPRCRSHEYGNDAVALLNIGCSEGDDRLALAGRRLHMATIQALRSEVACSQSNIQGIFAALLDLLLASCYTVVSPGVDVWLSHLTGQTHILKSKLTEINAPGFCTFLFAHYRQLNLTRSLIYRKRMPLAASDWNLGKVDPSCGHSEVMYRLAVKIPAILETTDQLLSSTDDNTGETTRLIVALLNLECSLLEWFNAWVAFRSSREPLMSYLTGLDTTSTIYDVLCFEDGLLMGLVWCLLLLTHEGVHDLAQSLQSDIYTETRKTSLHKANTYAWLLYRSVPHLCQQAGAPLSQALAVSGPLHFATRWFSRISDTERFESCVALQSNLRAKAPYLDWDVTLFWSFLSINWLIDE